MDSSPFHQWQIFFVFVEISSFPHHSEDVSMVDIGVSSTCLHVAIEAVIGVSSVPTNPRPVLDVWVSVMVRNFVSFSIAISCSSSQIAARLGLVIELWGQLHRRCYSTSHFKYGLLHKQTKMTQARTIRHKSYRGRSTVACVSRIIIRCNRVSLARQWAYVKSSGQLISDDASINTKRF